MGNYTLKLVMMVIITLNQHKGSAKLVVMPYYTSIFIMKIKHFMEMVLIYACIYDNLGDAMVKPNSLIYYNFI